MSRGRAVESKVSMDRGRWVRAAVHAFRHGGREAVRVDVLARQAGISRGSFYHHFRDRAELLEAVLEMWEQETDDIIREARKASTPRERLYAFFRRAQETEAEYPPDVEILAWAREDAEVAALARKVERRRLTFIRQQLEATGMAADEARRRGEIAYLATQGWVSQAGYGARRPSSRAAFTADVFDLMLGL